MLLTVRRSFRRRSSRQVVLPGWDRRARVRGSVKVSALTGRGAIRWSMGTSQGVNVQ